METTLFYGAPGGSSLGSIIALEWLGQPYRLSRIEMLQQPWDAAFASINPKMKTPVLVLEDGGTLTESLAILLHIGQRDLDKQLGFLPGTRDFDRLTEMLSYLTTDFFASFAPLWEAYESAEPDPARNEILCSLGQKSVMHEFAILERLLSDKKWLLGGDRPTGADAYLFAVARWADYHRVCDMEKTYPVMYRYLRRMRDDPAVRFAVDIEEGKEATGNGSFTGHASLQEVIEQSGFAPVL